MPPTRRQSLDLLLLGEDPPFTRRRQVGASCPGDMQPVTVGCAAFPPESLARLLRQRRDPVLNLHQPPQVALTALGIGSALSVALIAPTAAERIISVVGATGVCMVSYIIPVAIQIRGHGRSWRHPDDDAAQEAAARYLLWHRRGACGSSGGGANVGGRAVDGGSGLTAPLLGAPFATVAGRDAAAAAPAGCAEPAAAGGASASHADGGQPVKGDEEEGGAHGGVAGCWAWWCEVWEGLVEPLLVLVIGVGFSVAALWVAVAALADQPQG